MPEQNLTPVAASRAQLPAVKRTYEDLIREISDPAADLHPAVVAVLALHRPVLGYDGTVRAAPVCDECAGGDDYLISWPCKTFKAVRDAIR